MSYDVTLTEDPEEPGTALAHRPDCPAVDVARAAGEPLCTMICVELPLSHKLKRHSCLDGVELS